MKILKIFGNSKNYPESFSYEAIIKKWLWLNSVVHNINKYNKNKIQKRDWQEKHMIGKKTREDGIMSNQSHYILA